MNTRTQFLQMPGRDLGARLAFFVGCANEPGMLDSDDVAFRQSLAKLLLEFSQCALRNGIDSARFAHINKVPDFNRLEFFDVLDLADERQHMLAGIRSTERAAPDLLFSGRSLEADDGRQRLIIRREMLETPGQLSRRIRAVDDVPEDTLHFVPDLIVRVIPAVV